MHSRSLPKRFVPYFEQLLSKPLNFMSVRFRLTARTNELGGPVHPFKEGLLLQYRDERGTVEHDPSGYVRGTHRHHRWAEPASTRLD